MLLKQHLAWPPVGTTQENAETTQETGKENAETTQEKLLVLFKENPNLSAKSFAKALGITFDGVRYHLARLRKAGRIHHEGPTKGGRWVVDC